ncbi:protease inhibitor I42 family protein [Xanthomonas sp. PPL139]|uniref:protease inhibitor I42 family protein n=1 Tax=unclassified Xanthomonas TaxID=2643310 RepID=UPI0033B9F9E7
MTRAFLLLMLSAAGAISLPAVAAPAPVGGGGDCARGSIALVTGDADKPGVKTCLTAGMTRFVLKRGQVAAIVLPENATTGMSWALRRLPAPLSLLDVEHGQDAACGAGMVGCGGSVTYTFKALERGDGVVDLNYGHPWEDQAVESRSVKFVVK